MTLRHSNTQEFSAQTSGPAERANVRTGPSGQREIGTRRAHRILLNRVCHRRALGPRWRHALQRSHHRPSPKPDEKLSKLVRRSLNLLVAIAPAVRFAARRHGIRAAFLLADALYQTKLGTERIASTCGPGFLLSDGFYTSHPIIVFSFHSDHSTALYRHFDSYAAALAYQFPKALEFRDDLKKVTRAICVPHAAGDFFREARITELIDNFGLLKWEENDGENGDD